MGKEGGRGHTAQHSTAQHSTAQHRTAQHSTAHYTTEGTADSGTQGTHAGGVGQAQDGTTGLTEGKNRQGKSLDTDRMLQLIRELVSSIRM